MDELHIHRDEHKGSCCPFIGDPGEFKENNIQLILTENIKAHKLNPCHDLNQEESQGRALLPCKNSTQLHHTPLLSKLTNKKRFSLKLTSTMYMYMIFE